MSDTKTAVFAVAAAIVGVATLSVFLSRNANTVGVIGSIGSAFSSALGIAMGPVTGGKSSGSSARGSAAGFAGASSAAGSTIDFANNIGSTTSAIQDMLGGL